MPEPVAVARTVAVPTPLAGEVYKPLELTVPKSLSTDQVKPGCVAKSRPNWSFAFAVSWRDSPLATMVPVGATVTLVSFWATVTSTVLVTLDRPSEIVTRMRYVPARPKETVVFFAALVPLLLKDTPHGCSSTASHE